MAADRGGRASMAERIYPSVKPNAQPPQGAVTGTPPSKVGPLPVYRPQPRKPPPPRRRRRSCCCSCCLWFALILFLLILLSAAAFGVFYFIYRPQRPAFAVSALRLAAFNVSAGGRLTSRLDLNVTARNPNRKLVFLYDPASISVFSSGVDVGDGSFPAFRQGANNTTLLSATLAAGGGGGQTLDSAATRNLRGRTRLSLEIDVDTKVGVKIGSLKTKRIGVKVQCSGIEVAVPTGKAATTASTSNAACKVKPRVKIWKWTIS